MQKVKVFKHVSAYFFFNYMQIIESDKQYIRAGKQYIDKLMAAGLSKRSAENTAKLYDEFGFADLLCSGSVSPPGLLFWLHHNTPVPRKSPRFSGEKYEILTKSFVWIAAGSEGIFH